MTVLSQARKHVVHWRSGNQLKAGSCQAPPAYLYVMSDLVYYVIYHPEQHCVLSAVVQALVTHEKELGIDTFYLVDCCDRSLVFSRLPVASTRYSKMDASVVRNTCRDVMTRLQTNNTSAIRQQQRPDQTQRKHQTPHRIADIVQRPRLRKLVRYGLPPLSLLIWA